PWISTRSRLRFGMAPGPISCVRRRIPPAACGAAANSYGSPSWRESTASWSFPMRFALHSASKAWNIAGLKCALAVTGSARVDGALRTRMSVSPSDVRWRIGQLGAIASTAAFRDGEAWLDELRAYLDGNRRLLAELLADRLPKIAYRMPDATYLAWLDCRALGFDDAAGHFLDGGRVALERGSKFGAAGDGFVRLNYGTSRAILREIVDRMGAASK